MTTLFAILTVVSTTNPIWQCTAYPESQGRKNAYVARNESQTHARTEAVHYCETLSHKRCTDVVCKEVPVRR